MLNFATAWPSIVSDRLTELDDELRRPIQSSAVVRAETAAYLTQRAALHPEEPDSRVAALFHSLLVNLEEAGEDIDRLFDWTVCLTSYLQPLAARTALKILKQPFDRFARGQRTQAISTHEDLMEELAIDWAEEVLHPRLVFNRRCAATGRTWINRPGSRSAWDTFLWDRVFAEIDVDPALGLKTGFGDMLAREWWRRRRMQLSDNELHTIWAALIVDVRAFSRVPQAWILDASIDESMILLGIPEFDQVAFSAPR